MGLLKSVLSTCEGVRTYHCSGKDEGTSGSFILQTGHFYSTSDGNEMSCKSAQNERTTEKAPEELVYGSIIIYLKHVAITCLRVFHICVGI